MSQVVLFQAKKIWKEVQEQTKNYHLKLNQMDKAELLDEMVRYQKERARLGKLTLSLLSRGRVLFKKIQTMCQTKELFILAKAYARHLEYELEQFFKRGKLSS